MSPQALLAALPRRKQLFEAIGSDGLELADISDPLDGEAFIDSWDQAVDAGTLVRVDDRQPIGMMPSRERPGILCPATVAFVLLRFLRSNTSSGSPPSR